MTSLSDVRIGSQVPTLLHQPAGGVTTAGDDCIELAATAGLILDPWQQDCLRGAMAERSGGKWAAFEVGLVVPRQNGKNGIILARQLGGMYLFGERLQVHTAHEFKTTYEHFTTLKTLIEDTPDLEREVKIIRTGEGSQSIELLNRQRLRFLARSRKSGRGLTGDTTYLDEAMFLTATQVGALLPTMRTKPNPQLWYTTSGPEFASAFLHGLLKRAEAGDPDEVDLYLAAWESASDVRYDDEDIWYRCNPTLGIRVTIEQMRKEWRTLRSTPEGIAEFARELLGIREGGGSVVGCVNYAQWQSLKEPPDPVRGEPGSFITSGRCIGLSVSQDAAWSSFAVAGNRPDGLVHLETIERRAGTGWVVDRAEELAGRHGVPIRVRPTGVEGALLKELAARRVEVVEVKDREYAQACVAVAEWIKNGRLRHLNQETMNRSVSAAGKSGDTALWTWVPPSGVDISPLVAVTQAAAGVMDLGSKESVYEERGMRVLG